MRKLLALLMMMTTGVFASTNDINPGYVFQAGEKNITHSKLNSLVDQAIINTTFYTDKSASTTPNANDSFLVYSIANNAFRRLTLNTILYNNTALITGQTADTAPGGTETFLSYLPSSAAYRQVTLGNIFNQFQYQWAFTNLAQVSSLTNADLVPVWDSINNSNRSISVQSLLSGMTSTYATNGDIVPVYSQTNGRVESVSVDSIAIVATNLAYPIVSNLTFHTRQTYVTAQMGLVANSQLTNTAHFLTNTPQIVRIVIVCNTADNGYAVGDELEMDGITSGGATPYFHVGANATNVFAACTSTTPTIRSKDGTTSTSATSGRWKAKIYAVYFP